MQDSESARDRSRAYELLARLFADGVRTDDLAVLRSVDVLAEHIEDPFNADEASADHYAVLGTDVLAYAGVYLEPGGRAAGTSAERILRLAAEAGCTLDQSTYSADHVSNELHLLSYMLRADAQAVDERRGAGSNHARELQQRVLREHVAAWMPPFLEALAYQPIGFYQALSQLTLDVLIDHAQDLFETVPAGSDGCLPDAYQHDTGPSIDEMLERADTSVKDIAECLTTPSSCGLYISPGDIARWARRDHLPRGFGSRRQTLVNLLRSAAEYDGVGAVADALLGRIAQCRAYYGRIQAEGGAPIDAAVAPWMARLAATERLAELLRDAVASTPVQ